MKWGENYGTTEGKYRLKSKVTSGSVEPFILEMRKRKKTTESP